MKKSEEMKKFEAALVSDKEWKVRSARPSTVSLERASPKAARRCLQRLPPSFVFKSN